MKIKSIDNFTWEECNEYLNSNPNGEYVQKVLERMKYLSQSKERESHNAHEDFLKQFNRLYVTGKYNDAFLLCLNSINTPSISSSAYDNAKRVIPFLSQNGIIPVLNCINMDIIIDVLIENGYNKMQLRGDSTLCLTHCIVSLNKKDKAIQDDNFIRVVESGPFTAFGALFIVLLPLSIPLIIHSIKLRRKMIEQICISLLEYMKTH